MSKTVELDIPRKAAERIAESDRRLVLYSIERAIEAWSRVMRTVEGDAALESLKEAAQIIRTSKLLEGNS